MEASLRDIGLGVSLAGLEEMAKMETIRRVWKVGIFTISLDDSVLLLDGLGEARGKILEIPHSVGEVELCEEVAERDVEKRTREMTTEIDEFMERYKDVFRGRYEWLCPQVPEAKLAAFFRWWEVIREQRFVPRFKWDDEKDRFVSVIQHMFEKRRRL